MTRAMLGCVLVCALVGLARGAEPDLMDTRKKFGPHVLWVPLAKQLPTVDGKLDDACWQGAAPVTLVRSTGNWWDPPSQKTEARVLADAKNIYFAVRCFEAEPARIVAGGKPRDGMVVGADTVEFFLDPGHRQERFNYFHVIVTPDGSVHRGKGLKTDAKTEGWQGNVTARTGKFEGGWTVEAAIPLADLDVKEGSIPKVWGLNVCRQRPELGADMPKAARAAGDKRFNPSQWLLDDVKGYRFAEYSCWSPTMIEFSGWPFYADSRPFHYVQRFGHAVLEAGTVDVPPPAKTFEVLLRSDFDDGQLGPFEGAAIAADNFRGPGKSMTFADGKSSIRLAQALEDVEDVTLVMAYRGMTYGDKLLAGGGQHLRISGAAPDGRTCGAERYEIFMQPEIARKRTQLLEQGHRDEYKHGPFELYDTHADMVRWKPVGRAIKGPGGWDMVEGYFAEPSPTQVRWTGGDWAIVRIRLSTFRRTPGPNQGQRLVPREQGYPKGLVLAANPKDNIRFDDVVIYRGADGEAPEQVTGVKLQKQGDQVEVTWNKARDNTLTACYRIYAGKKLLKETPELTAKLSASEVGAEGVSIVAVDLEGNASQPSATAR